MKYKILVIFLLSSVIFTPSKNLHAQDIQWVQQVEWSSELPLIEPIVYKAVNVTVSEEGYLPSKDAPTSGFYILRSSTRCWEFSITSGTFTRFWENKEDCPKKVMLSRFNFGFFMEKLNILYISKWQEGSSIWYEMPEGSFRLDFQDSGEPKSIYDKQKYTFYFPTVSTIYFPIV